jgi:hypothetical protein
VQLARQHEDLPVLDLRVVRELDGEVLRRDVGAEREERDPFGRRPQVVLEDGRSFGFVELVQQVRHPVSQQVRALRPGPRIPQAVLEGPACPLPRREVRDEFQEVVHERLVGQHQTLEQLRVGDCTRGRHA